MASDGNSGSFGISHLSSMPVTLTFGVVLLFVLVVLVLLRVLFGSVSVSGGVK
jgi:hypothetical protein